MKPLAPKEHRHVFGLLGRFDGAWKPSREEQKQAIETLLYSGLDRDTRAVIRDIEEKLAEKNRDH